MQPPHYLRGRRPRRHHHQSLLLLTSFIYSISIEQIKKFFKNIGILQPAKLTDISNNSDINNRAVTTIVIMKFKSANEILNVYTKRI